MSTQRNRSELAEVLATAFAAEFLGIKRFLESRQKGLRSRTEMLVFDLAIDSPELGPPKESLRATTRPVAGSQKVAYQDVVALAHMFGASYQAAAYLLKALNAINQTELEELLEKEGMGREYLKALHFSLDIDSEEAAPGDRDLTKQIVDLGIEAFRRGLIN